MNLNALDFVQRVLFIIIIFAFKVAQLLGAPRKPVCRAVLWGQSEPTMSANEQTHLI